MPEPTKADFLHASQAIYYPDHPEMLVQAGLRPFCNRNGTPLTKNEGAMIGAAYLDGQNNVIIAFQGTNISNAHSLMNPATKAQIGADAEIMRGVRPPGFSKALDFASTVIREAKAQGIAASQVYATGHSLGGAEAEYVAQQKNIGGQSFGAPGQPFGKSTQSAGSPTFISHVAYGDPVGNYASDALEQPLAGAAAYHYGKVRMVGQPGNQAGLARDVATASAALQELTHPTSAESSQGAVGALEWAQLHGLTANVDPYHSLDRSYAPALGVVPLPEPQAARKQADLPPRSGWAAVAMPEIVMPEAAIPLAIAERLAQSGEDNSAKAFWRAVADKASTSSLPSPVAVATGTAQEIQPSPQAAPSRGPGLRAR